MFRLLVVDDEEIITEALYEVLNQSMGDELEIYKAFSAKEALNWLSRTRIDIVLTDIRMPGMSGIELMQEIHAYWPRCRIVFLTGYSEFDYAYQAIQKPNVKYLLKTEGYAKVIQTIQEVINEINYDHHINSLLKQSEQHKDALMLVAQGDYFRHCVLSDIGISEITTGSSMAQDFERLNIKLEASAPVVLVLAHLSYAIGTTFSDISERIASVKQIWSSFLSGPINSVAIVDKQGDLVWFLQSSGDADEKISSHMLRYVEGMLELIQQTCYESLEIAVSFTMSGEQCSWSQVVRQYERLRQLQKMNMNDGIPIIQIDYPEQASASYQEVYRIAPKAEIMSAHLDAGRAEHFFSCFSELEDYILNKNEHVHRSVEAYYAIALMLLSYMNRNQLHEQIREYNKLMRLDEHSSMKEAFHYLRALSEQIFASSLLNERDRASIIIEKICKYIQEHLSEDLSLVRLAELHYFNPSYLSRFFKQERGVKLSEYIDDCRMKKAKELLCSAELKVRDVALQVGYEAAHSFTRFFKKSTGMTPQEYRDSLIENEAIR